MLLLQFQGITIFKQQWQGIVGNLLILHKLIMCCNSSKIMGKAAMDLIYSI